jgi:hypothetical protein
MGRKKYLCSMIRNKKIFVLIHITCWTLLCLLAALATQPGYFLLATLTVGFMLTGLYVFYSHFFLLTRYSGKRKKGAYFLRLAGIM